MGSGDTLKELWALQASQQSALGLDPEALSAVERRALTSDLLLLLHEESGEAGRVLGSYKRHILVHPEIHREALAEELADVVKTVFALGQLHGVLMEDFVDAFKRKTAVVTQKHAAFRLELGQSTKLLCTDLDDVVCDLAPWREELVGRCDADPDATPGERLAASESMKAQFYVHGRFQEMAPVVGAPEALARLKALGWTIVIITARPQWQHKRLYADTLSWLDKHRIAHDLVLFNKDKVEALYEHVVPAWPVAFVEDHERNARALADVGVKVLLYDQPHNQNVAEGDSIRRVRSWAEILEYLT